MYKTKHLSHYFIRSVHINLVSSIIPKIPGMGETEAQKGQEYHHPR